MRVENGNISGVGGGNSSGSVRSIVADPKIQSGDGDDASADTVRLSSATNLVAQAKNVSSSERQLKIASLASQIRSGTYQVNSSQVSQAIINQLR